MDEQQSGHEQTDSIRTLEQQHSSTGSELAGTSNQATAVSTTTTTNAGAGVSSGDASSSPNLPPKPDTTRHDHVLMRYRRLQKKHADLLADRTKLLADLALAENKVDKLQCEADMLIEQMHELDPKISLATDYVDLSSDEEDVLIDGNAYKSGFSAMPPHRAYYLQSFRSIPQGGPSNTTDDGSQLPDEKHRTSGPGMLSPLLLQEEEARVEAERKRSLSETYTTYNPDNVRVRIGVMPVDTTAGPSHGANEPGEAQS